jgi:hypothetical protein
MKSRSPSGRLVRLLILCFAVGVALSFAGITTAGDILGGLANAAFAVLGLIWANADWILRLVALGAVVVVPLWLAGKLIDAILTGIAGLFRRRKPAPPVEAYVPPRRPQRASRPPEPRATDRRREERPREARARDAWPPSYPPQSWGPPAGDWGRTRR